MEIGFFGVLSCRFCQGGFDQLSTRALKIFDENEIKSNGCEQTAFRAQHSLSHLIDALRKVVCAALPLIFKWIFYAHSHPWYLRYVYGRYCCDC